MFVFVHMCACEYDLNNDVSGNKQIYEEFYNYIFLKFLIYLP